MASMPQPEYTQPDIYLNRNMAINLNQPQARAHYPQTRPNPGTGQGTAGTAYRAYMSARILTHTQYPYTQGVGNMNYTGYPHPYTGVG